MTIRGYGRDTTFRLVRFPLTYGNGSRLDFGSVSACDVDGNELPTPVASSDLTRFASATLNQRVTETDNLPALVELFDSERPHARLYFVGPTDADRVSFEVTRGWICAFP